MRKIFILILFPLISLAQNYNGPESIEYHDSTGSYFISNSNNGQILELDVNNELSIFALNLGSGPHGLEIVNNILYVCSGGRLKGYNINDGSQVLNYNINGTFLNGITHKENTLFITDFSDRKLFSFNIETESHEEVISFNKNPNGTYWDEANNQLLVVFWGNNAPIYTIDYLSQNYSVILNTGLGNLDGITMDQCGNFYISAWSSNSIHKYNNDFSETEVVATNLSYPADICFNQNENILAVPNSGNNSISLIQNPCNEETEINENNYERKIVSSTNILGKFFLGKGFKIEIYDDGSTEKKYILNK